MLNHKRDHNVYILGAGFSKNAGLPLMNDFMDKIRRKFEDPETEIEPSLESDYKIVLDYRNALRSCRDYINADLDNIETLFSLISMDCLAGEADKERVHKAIRRVIADIVSPANTTLGTTYFRFEKSLLQELKIDLEKDHIVDTSGIQRGADTINIDQYSFFCAITGKIITKKKFHKDTILTFNYDTIIEDRAHGLGINIDYGFEDTTNEGLKLLKLHGSINWQETIDANHPTLIDMNKTVFHDPAIIPPTWQKTPNIWLQRIWGKAIEAIADATNIIIIGYSMPETDSYFKHLITAGLSKNPGINKIIVVDKCSEKNEASSLNKKYSEIFSPLVSYKRYFYFSQGLEGFLYNATSSYYTEYINRDVISFSR